MVCSPSSVVDNPQVSDSKELDTGDTQHSFQDLNDKLITFQLQNTESHIWFEKVDILQMFIDKTTTETSSQLLISIDFLVLDPSWKIRGKRIFS